MINLFNMKIKHLLFSALALLSGNAFASRSLDAAKNVAKDILSKSDNIYLSDVKTVNNDTICYTFKGSNGGYAVISADTRVPAVLAYSEKGSVYPKLPGMIDVFAENIENNKHLNMGLSESADTSELRATRILNSPIEPLLKNITWGQNQPFNLNTPLFDNVNAPVGCVATALGQILCYYRYPNATISDIPAYTTETEGIAMEGVAKGTVLDWDNILDCYNYGYADKNATAVSNLMTVVCSSVGIDFKATESSSAKTCINQLVDVFGYDPDLIKMSFRSSYSFGDWSKIIYDELKNNRPVLMAGFTVAGGHRFLCDGIDKNGLFHINWGWNGDSDGYYDLALLNPNTTTETGASTSTDGYSRDNYIVYGIQPDNGVKDIVEERADIDALSVTYQIDNGSLYLFFSYSNNSPVNKSVYLACGYIDDNGNVVKVADIGDYVLEPFMIFDQLESNSLDFSTFKNGKSYKIGLIESKDNVNWKPTNGFDNVNYEFIVNNGTVMIGTSDLSATTEIKDFNAVGQYAHGVIHLKNNGGREYYDVIYLMTNSVNENPLQYSYVCYATAEAKDSNDVDFKFVAQSDTVYYWVMDSKLNLLDNGVFYKEEKERKVSATVRIDTSEYGLHVCRATLKNEGEVCYDNSIRVILFHADGQAMQTIQAYVEPGKEFNTWFYVDENIEYSQYYVYDNYANVIGNGEFCDISKMDTLLLDFACSEYNTSTKVVNGDLVIRNERSETYKNKFMVLLDTTNSFSQGELLDFVEVEVAPYEIKYYPLSLPVDRDSCTLLFISQVTGDGFYLQLIATPGNDAVDNVVADANKLVIWTNESALVVEAADDASLQITASNGRVLTSRRLYKGERFSQNLPAGVYIVNGKKILIK